jgi:hypothetical protein
MSDKMSDSRRRRAVWPSSRATTCLTQKLEVNPKINNFGYKKQVVGMRVRGRVRLTDDDTGL